MGRQTINSADRFQSDQITDEWSLKSRLSGFYITSRRVLVPYRLLLGEGRTVSSGILVSNDDVTWQQASISGIKLPSPRLSACFRLLQFLSASLIGQRGEPDVCPAARAVGGPGPRRILPVHSNWSHHWGFILSKHERHGPGGILSFPVPS